MALPARPAVRRRRPGGCSTCTRVVGGQPLGRRLRPQRRREDQHPGPARRHPTRPAGARRPMRVEHEYERGGALAYLAAWDVRRAASSAAARRPPASRRSAAWSTQVMAEEPYASPRASSGSSTTAAATAARPRASVCRAQYPNLLLVHLPIHASWLNQIEIYFSIVQRKVLTPNDFADLRGRSKRLLAFEHRTSKSPIRSSGSSLAMISTSFFFASPSISRSRCSSVAAA